MANILLKQAVAAATTADLGGTFALGATPTSDTITGTSNVALTVDGYTAVLNDRILVKNQTTASQNGIYFVSQAGGTTVGPLATVTIANAGAGYVSGTYLNVPLLGGTGFGAKATVVVGALSAGSIDTLGTITGGSGYVNGAYSDITLLDTTTGTATGAKASLTVSGGAVTDVVLSAQGTGYVVADVLTAIISTTSVAASTGPVGAVTITTAGAGYTDGTYYNVALSGGTGTGAAATVVVSGGAVTSVTINNPGTGYTVADALSVTAADVSNPTPTTAAVITVDSVGVGSGFSIPVATILAGVTSVTVTDGGSTFPMYDSYPSYIGYTVGDTLTVDAVYLGNVGAAVGSVGGPGTGLELTVATVTGSPWVLRRTLDANTSNKFANMVVEVLHGTTNGSTAWKSGGAVSLDVGPVATFGTVVGGSGYTDGTYNNVTLFDNIETGSLAAIAQGAGFGASANITVAGGAVTAVALGTIGPISTLGAVTGGTGYTDGTHTNVPLSGGTGSGAYATVVVASGAVTTVTVTNPGVGYTAGDTLSASNLYFGIGDTNAGGEAGNGSGFSVPVSAVSVGGLHYSVGQTLTVPVGALNPTGAAGTGFEVPVATVTAGTPSFTQVTL